MSNDNCKNIIVIEGSPRKGGNGDTLSDLFIEGATSKGHKVNKVYVKDLDLKFCTACDACTHNGKCVHKDGMDGVLDAMVESDVIMLVTPVYFYSMSALMKCFIDRCRPRYREIKDKKFIFLVVAADSNKDNLESTMLALKGFVDCLSGDNEIEKIYAPGLWKKHDIDNEAFKTLRLSLKQMGEFV